MRESGNWLMVDGWFRFILPLFSARKKNYLYLFFGFVIKNSIKRFYTFLMFPFCHIVAASEPLQCFFSFFLSFICFAFCDWLYLRCVFINFSFCCLLTFVLRFTQSLQICIFWMQTFTLCYYFKRKNHTVAGCHWLVQNNC